jgi:glycerol-1-phosphate dehydrogenase [NAD(P)+]
MESAMRKIWNLPRVDYVRLHEHREARPVALVYSLEAWAVVEPRLRLDVASHLPVREATLAAWASLAEQAEGAVVYAVGGGLAADAGKLVAARRGLPLWMIPTAISVDAPFTWASGYREGGAVRYLETTVAERLLVDLDVIAGAPERIRAAGITDVLSIATGAWDWQFAHERDRNPSGMSFQPWAHRIALEILELALDAATGAGRGAPEALRALLDALALEVQLCNQLGHSRPEEGSEHYFAYAVENHLGKGLPHGDLVGPGIVLAAALQGQPVDRLIGALRACHVPLDRIAPETVRATLLELPAYCARHDYPFGIASVLDERAVDRAIETLFA